MTSDLYTLTDLPEPQDLFGQLIAQAPFAVWVADSNGDVVLFNETMKELVGIEDPKKVLEHYNIFEDPIAKAQGLSPYIRKVLEGQTIQTVLMLDLSREAFGSQGAPKVYYVRAVYFPLKDEEGETEYVVTIIENITQDYLEDIALSKMTKNLQEKQEEVIDQEREIVRAKRKIASLKAQVNKLRA